MTDTQKAEVKRLSKTLSAALNEQGAGELVAIMALLAACGERGLLILARSMTPEQDRDALLRMLDTVQNEWSGVADLQRRAGYQPQPAATLRVM